MPTRRKAPVGIRTVFPAGTKVQVRYDDGGKIDIQTGLIVASTDDRFVVVDPGDHTIRAIAVARIYRVIAD